ncbi:DUF3852 domain-containing protein [Oscillospiraceae bacterium OttesenSCG-928-G22]|nr:DUF3852 domain-containing protein [Oscillospiraceae bacterium OttesenSCG-928-G22]
MRKRVLTALLVTLLLCTALSAPALATSGDASGVANAIESTWKAAATQVKTVVNNVVFPAIDLILAVLFFVKLATAWMDYRKHGSFEFAGPAILFAGLILALTAPLYLWTIIGI